MSESLDNVTFQDILAKIKTDLQDIDWEGMSKREYEQDRVYPENFSNWYYEIENKGDFEMADIVSHQILTWEETEAFKETDEFISVDFNKLRKILQPTLDKLNPRMTYNMKNGCFSNKFDFDICTVTKDRLPEKLWILNYQSALFETGGFTEVVIRENIPFEPANNLTIYNGMPLRTEVRVFYNMDTKEIEYMEDYWNYDYCANYLYSLNDRKIFDIFHNKIGDVNIIEHKKEYETVCQLIQNAIGTLKFSDKLKGIWSVDFMYVREKAKVYLIDMARGFRSAYWDINKLKSETRKQFENNK